MKYTNTMQNHNTIPSAASEKESDAGDADAAGKQQYCVPKEELLDGPPPCWRSGYAALSASGIKAEELGLDKLPGYEQHANEDEPEGNIILGQD
jgi:hypothetical protein